MRTFIDNTKRQWSLSVNVDSIRRVKAMTGINLIEILDGKLLEKLSTDPILLCDVIYALAKVDADAQKISAEDFGRAMAGDAIEAATNALFEDLIDFFPVRRRQLLTKALKKVQELDAKAMDLGEKKIDSLNVETVVKNASASFGNLPVS